MEHIFEINGTTIPIGHIDYVTFSKEVEDGNSEFDIVLKSGNRINFNCKTDKNAKERNNLLRCLEEYLTKTTKVFAPK